MSVYTKPIIRYGLLTPVAMNLVLLAVVLGLTAKLQKTRSNKEERYRGFLSRLASIKLIEEEIQPAQKVFEGQRAVLQADPSQIFTRLCESILSKYRQTELERTGMIFPQDRGRIARHLQADAVRVKSSFEGGFGPMQETLFQVESVMPNAVLEELKVTPAAEVLSHKPQRLVFEMSHVCWRTQE